MSLFRIPKPMEKPERYQHAFNGTPSYDMHELWKEAEGFVRDEHGRLSTADRDFSNRFGKIENMTFHRCDWTRSKTKFSDRMHAFDSLFVELFRPVSRFKKIKLERCFFDLAHFDGLLDSWVERCSFFRAKHAFSFKFQGKIINEHAPGCVWNGTTMRSCNLAEAHLQDAMIDMVVTDTRFCGARLRRAAMTYAYMRKTAHPESTFPEAEGSRFTRCDFSYADLEECDMVKSVFEHCIFDCVEGTPIVDESTILLAPHLDGPAPEWFSRCTVVWPGRARRRDRKRLAQAGITTLTDDVVFPSWWSTLPYLLLRDHREWWAQASRERDPSDPRRLVLEGVDLRDAIVPQGTFSGAILRGCNLGGALVGRCEQLEAIDCDFEGAQISALMDSQLTRCTFDRATMVVAYFDHSEIRGCSFKEMIGRISFRDATLIDCCLDRAQIACLEFFRSHVEHCSMREMKLLEAEPFASNRFVLSEINDCDFSASDFDRASIIGSTFTRCNFSHVKTQFMAATSEGERYALYDNIRNPVIGADPIAEAGETTLIDPIATDGDPEWFAKCKVIRTAKSAAEKGKK